MIDKLSEAMAAILPADLGKELRSNIDAVIRSNFDKMNLVTREQFEIQEKVLHRTRGRILELEKQVAELEKLINVAAGKESSDSVSESGRPDTD